MGLIFDENYREIDAFYDFVLNDVGADKLKLNFIQPSFGHDASEDEFFANHHRVDPDELYDMIGECDRKYNLGLNPLWREQVRMYFRSLPKATTLRAAGVRAPGRRAHLQHLRAQHHGGPLRRRAVVLLDDFPRVPAEEARRPRHFWHSAEFIRRSMRRCNQFCGISHSVRRETSTVASRRPIPVPVVAAAEARRKALFDYSFTLTPR